MSSSRKACAVWLLCLASAWAAAQGAAYPGIGRTATAKEVAAWDIDVRPDFQGLPPGAGSVAQGQDLWEAKCAQCHGIFGESNEVFSPLVGGTTADDVKTGHVASLRRTDFPGRTTLMKVATVSTLWDYIRRAMPWTAPKSLQPDEVYALVAYLLSLADVVPEDFVLSDQNIADVQRRMPNRNGMDTAHALWPGHEFKGVPKPDTANVACMKNCVPETKVASMLPAHARNAHGNLAEQNRLVGEQHGVDTTVPEGQSAQAAVAVDATPKVSNPVLALLEKNACTTCHAMDRKVIGPSFAEVAKKHAGHADYLAGKIRSGGVGLWGQVTMPAQTAPEADIRAIADWLAAGAAK